MSATTIQLRENMCIPTMKEVVRGRIRGLEEEESRSEYGKAYKEGLKVCVERARALTESFKATEGEPMVVRRAKALARILETMTVYIGDEERIVGNAASSPGALPIYPELYQRWVGKALNDGYRNLIDDDGREEAAKICDYWSGKAIDDRARVLAPESIKGHFGFNGVAQWFFSWIYCAPNYDRLFKDGLNGVIKEVEERLEALGKEMDMPVDEYIRRKELYEGIVIVLRAVVKFGQRYAEKASELASTETSEERRKELEEISEICERVPGNPPRSFHEALQFFWFIHLVAMKIETTGTGTGIRFDQIVYPFYAKDVKEGRITREAAQELIEFLWLKFEGLGTHLSPPAVSGYYAGAHMNQTLTLGGVTPSGEDATNEISYIMLDASKAMKTVQPTLALRYHEKIPQELILKAIDVVRAGVGYPAFYNDKSLIPQLIQDGIPLEDARNYTIEGCVDVYIPGKNMKNRCSVAYFCLPKCLELALNKGIDKFSGRQSGCPTADPQGFSSVEDVMEAYLKQVNFFVSKLVKINNLYEALFAEYIPRPFASGVLDDCIELGKESATWSYYSRQIILVLGPTNVINSLAAMKKLVFEDKRITMDELLDALKNNFEGSESLRLMLLNEVPKYGNDDDYVDRIAAEVHKRTNEEIRKFTDFFGGRYNADGSGTSANFGLSVGTGATPDGRKDKEVYADAVLSPSLGSDNTGPTAVLKSASKIDPYGYSYLLNQKFLPQYLEGESKKVFAQYLKTWADLGVSHIQFNVVDKKTLVNAQKHPEKHTNLVVRVAGYSAYFADLSKGLQDLIIERTEQRL